MRQILIVFMFVRKKYYIMDILWQYGVGLSAFTGFDLNSELTGVCWVPRGNIGYNRVNIFFIQILSFCILT